VRGSSLGLALLCAVLAFRLQDRYVRWLAGGLAASVTAYSLLGGGFAKWPWWLTAALRLVAVLGPYCFWALSRALFEEHFRFSRWHCLIVGPMVMSSLVRSLVGESVSATLVQVVRLGVTLPTLVLGGQIMWRMLSDLRSDLIETRRTFRIVFLVAGAALLLAGALPVLMPGRQPAPVETRLLRAVALLVLELVLAALLIEFRNLVGVATPAPATDRQKEPGGGPESEEARLATRLLETMEGEQIYRETGLTIGALAVRVQLPEYRLRRLINQYLGYRNFTDFLNRWRLAEATRRLSDPAEARLPILSIALDLGYGSIGPFNRAFKTATGVTPSEYRRLNTPG